MRYLAVLYFFFSLVLCVPHAVAFGTSPGYWRDTGFMNGLIGWWKFHEGVGTTVEDASGKGNPATLINGPTWVAGKTSPSALNFNGVNSSATVGLATLFDNLGPLSISVWIKPNSAGGSSLGKIAVKGTGLLANNWQFMILSANLCYSGSGAGILTNSLVFSKQTSAGFGRVSRCSVSNAVTLGVWQHVVMTWDGSSTMAQIQFYVNGVETAYADGFGGGGAATSDTGNSITIGNRPDGARAFDGPMNDLRIYNRVLTAAEVAALFKAVP